MLILIFHKKYLRKIFLLKILSSMHHGDARSLTAFKIALMQPHWYSILINILSPSLISASVILGCSLWRLCATGGSSFGSISTLPTPSVTACKEGFSLHFHYIFITFSLQNQKLLHSITVKWFNFMGNKFRGLMTTDMLVDTWICGFQIIISISKVNEYFVWILNL